MAGLATLCGEMLGRSSKGAPLLLVTVMFEGVKPSLALNPVDALMVFIEGVMSSISSCESASKNPE